jgi:hypothetical protein
MNHTRKRRLGAVVAVCAIALVLGTGASAGLILNETFHDEDPSPSTTSAASRVCRSRAHSALTAAHTRSHAVQADLLTSSSTSVPRPR